MNFKNKTVVITGGAKGIGGSCSEKFVSAGANVCILDIDEKGKDLAEKLGTNAVFYKCDVSAEQEVKQTFENIKEQFSEIDILVNNAGIQRYGKITETTEEEWDLVMNVNLKSAFLCSKYAIPLMQNKKQACVINVASVQAFISQQNVAAYTTSKTALLGLTRSIAVDYAPNIRSVAVCPGTVDTPMLRAAIQLSPDPDEVYQECVDMHLPKRVGTSDEVAELILFLASDNASFITGQAIRIDGGLGISISGSKRD
ncbi:MAG: SDR family oxidoreductase [Ignavibacteriae bacterium]|nr:SDR family oxidoreductase [Ignavibacteriota bacterium]NOG97734.1 SDR family oxidoreductase [Ignavibacteriota bacterium]